MPLPGDCQINLQSSSFGTVGVGDGEGMRVGVSDSSGSVATNGEAVGVLDGSGVVDGLGVSVCVGMAVAEGDGVGVLISAAIGAESAAQAARESVRAVRSSVLLIAVRRTVC